MSAAGREGGSWAGRLAARVRASAWVSLAGKGLAAVAAFVVLALIGSGAIGGSLFRGGSTAFASAPSAVASARAPSVDAGAAPSGVADAGTLDVGAADAAVPPAAVTADGKVFLNLAGEEDLRRLPGIGKVRARAILELRARLGRFRRAEELLRVRGIGRRSFARLRPLVLLDPPS